MNLTAAAIRIMADKGLSALDIAEIAEAMEAAPVLDPVAEKRRAYDRERKRANSTGNSTGIPPETLPPSPPPFSSPEPPTNTPPISPQPSTKGTRLHTAAWSLPS